MAAVDDAANAALALRTAELERDRLAREQNDYQVNREARAVVQAAYIDLQAKLDVYAATL